MADIRYEIKRGNKWIQCIKSSPKAARIADSVPTEKGKTMVEPKNDFERGEWSMFKHIIQRFNDFFGEEVDKQ